MAKVDELASWLDITTKSYMKIWCEDPETNKGSGVLGKSYLTYRILLKQQGRDVVGIRHRYSEFEALQKTLFDRYAIFGILVPKLPPKKVIGSFVTRAESIFIKERTHGLSLFCQDIAANPFFRHDSSWKTFLNSNDPVSKSNDDSNNVGETNLIASLSLLDIGTRQTMQAKINDFRDEIKLIQGQVGNLIDKIKSAQSAMRNLQAANDAVNVALNQWATNEKSTVNSLNGKILDRTDNLLTEEDTPAQVVRSTCDLLLSKNAAMDDMPDYDSVLVIALLTHELSRMESFFDLFKVHEELISNISSLTTKLAKAEVSKNQKVLDTVPEVKLQIDEAQACLSAFYKGFVYFTLPLICKLRSITFRKLGKYIGATNLSSHYTVQKATEKFFAELKIDMNEAIANTNHTLDLFSLKPIAPLVATSNYQINDEAVPFLEIFQYAIRNHGSNIPPSSPTAPVSHVTPPPAPYHAPAPVTEEANPFGADSEDSNPFGNSHTETASFLASPNTVKNSGLLNDLVNNQEPVKSEVWDD